MFISRLARIEGETDPKRRGEMLKELFRPFAAFTRAASGEDISVRDVDAIMNNFPHIAHILRTLGYDEKEVAAAKRAFFARFAIDFPTIVGEAIESAGTHLNVEGPIGSILQTIATAMEPAGESLKALDKLKEIEGIINTLQRIADDKEAAIKAGTLSLIHI